MLSAVRGVGQVCTLPLEGCYLCLNLEYVTTHFTMLAVVCACAVYDVMSVIFHFIVKLLVSLRVLKISRKRDLVILRRGLIILYLINLMQLSKEDTGPC